jgi:hypothetical protein
MVLNLNGQIMAENFGAMTQTIGPVAVSIFTTNVIFVKNESVAFAISQSDANKGKLMPAGCERASEERANRSWPTAPEVGTQISSIPDQEAH